MDRYRIIMIWQLAATTLVVAAAVLISPTRASTYLTAYALVVGLFGLVEAMMRWMPIKKGPKAKKSKKKIALLVAIMASHMLVAAPLTEELLFRAPLIALFPSMNAPFAWWGVVVMTALFGAIHYPGIYGPDNKIGFARPKWPGMTRRQRIGRVLYQSLDVLQSAAVGLILGYVAISYQSLWLVIGLHSLANVIIPVLSVSVTGVRILLKRPAQTEDIARDVSGSA